MHACRPRFLWDTDSLRTTLQPFMHRPSLLKRSVMHTKDSVMHTEYIIWSSAAKLLPLIDPLTYNGQHKPTPCKTVQCASETEPHKRVRKLPEHRLLKGWKRRVYTAWSATRYLALQRRLIHCNTCSMNATQYYIATTIYVLSQSGSYSIRLIRCSPRNASQHKRDQAYNSSWAETIYQNKTLISDDIT